MDLNGKYFPNLIIIAVVFTKGCGDVRNASDPLPSGYQKKIDKYKKFSRKGECYHTCQTIYIKEKGRCFYDKNDIVAVMFY